MRDPKRIRKICNQLATLWETQPDFRLGQLVCSIAYDAGRQDADPFYVEDDQMLKAIENRLQGNSPKEEP